MRGRNGFYRKGVKVGRVKKGAKSEVQGVGASLETKRLVCREASGRGW